MFNVARRNSRDTLSKILSKSSHNDAIPSQIPYISRQHQIKSPRALLQIRGNASQQSPPLPGFPSVSSLIKNHLPKAPQPQEETPRPLQPLPSVTCLVRARIPTTNGTEMFLHLYKNSMDNKEHLAIVFGNEIRSQSLDAVRPGETEMDRLIRGAYTGTLYPGRTTSEVETETQTHTCSNPHHHHHQHNHQCDSAPLVRIHSECYTGETVWSARCDCGEQLDESAHLMGSATPSNPHPSGIIIYLRQEGRGIGLGEKLKAYNLQDLGADTVEANLILQHPADGRSYEVATAMLLDLGQKEIRLLTNNPEKVRAIEGPNQEIYVKERIAMVPLAWKSDGGIRSAEVEGYLKTKIEKMSHML